MLASLDLVESTNQWVTYPTSLPGLVRNLSYVDEYRFYISEHMFDCVLVDNSLVQFKLFDHGLVSYCYYQAPFDAPTYKEFVAEQFRDEQIELSDIGDLLREEYELAISTFRLRVAATPIRYDHSPEQYKPCIHPAAHIHIGSNNSIRIGARRLMLPLSFIMFIVRQMYPDSWRRYLDASDSASIKRAIRDELEHVHNSFHGDDDILQLILD